MDTFDEISEDPDIDLIEKVRAWGVHGLTACGVVAGLMSIAALVQHEWKLSFAYMMVATAIDGIDGTLARKFRVKVVLPGFDGALLDNIVDYFTFVIVPGVFIFMSDLVPAKFALVGAAAIALTSAYQFCQVDAKTGDHFFKGFPSYWNVLVLYLFLFQFNPWVNLALIAMFAVLVFIPIRYVYPTRTAAFRKITVTYSMLWAGTMIVLLVQFPEHPLWLLWGSMSYVAYYFLLSFYFTAKVYRAANSNIGNASS